MKKMSPMPIVNLLAGVMLIVLSAHGVDFVVGRYNEHISSVKAEVGDAAFMDGYTTGRNDAFDEMGMIEERIMEQLTLHHEQTKTSAENYIYSEELVERIMNKSNPNLSDKKKAEYKKYILKWSLKYNLSPAFVASMIHRETNFNENAVSKSNARGAMQVLYRYHKDKCDKIGIKEKDLHSINHGINIGCQVIRQYLDWNDGDYRAALEKYVGSVNNSADGYIRDIFSMTIYAHKKEN